MGVTLHYTMAVETARVKNTLNRTEELAREFKKEADALGYDFSINRVGDTTLYIDIAGCETLAFNFQTFDETWSNDPTDWLADEMRSKWLPFEQSPATSDHYKRWPGQVTLWTEGFCKTQYTEGIICHIWAAELVRSVAGVANVAKVNDEGTYYHTRNTKDASDAIADNQAMLDSLAGTFEALGYKVKKHK